MDQCVLSAIYLSVHHAKCLVFVLFLTQQLALSDNFLTQLEICASLVEVLFLAVKYALMPQLALVVLEILFFL